MDWQKLRQYGDLISKPEKNRIRNLFIEFMEGNDGLKEMLDDREAETLLRLFEAGWMTSQIESGNVKDVKPMHLDSWKGNHPKFLWEILVPATAKGEISVEYHKIWDAHVEKITGGLTINKKARGRWINPETGEAFVEEMIPVRIYCTKYEIKKIAEITMEHYKQEAVMYYMISDNIVIKRR